MKLHKSLLKFAATSAFIACFCLLAASCSNGSGDDSPKIPNKDIYLSSSLGGMSDYIQQSVKKSGYKYSTTLPDEAPGIFIIKGSEAGSLSDDQIIRTLDTCLAGKTVIIDSPSIDNMITFYERISSVLEEEEYENYSHQIDISPYSIYNITSEFTQDILQSEDYTQKAFELIAMRGFQIYYVHDIDEVLPDSISSNENTEIQSLVSSEWPGYNDTEEKDEVNAKENVELIEITETEYKSLFEASVTSFVEWLQATDSAEAAPQRAVSAGNTAIENAKKAQSFVHNFSAVFKATSDHYDGRYTGRCENVQTYIDVWAACDIDHNTDYYLVRTSLVCNNQQFNFKNDWENGKYVSPYMDYAEITTSLGNGNATVKSSDLQPTTTVGSSSFTKGMSMSFSGNVGFNASGPTGGISTGFSVSESRSQSIPDITVYLTPETNSKGATWKFAGPEMKPYWDGLVTACDGPKNIQTNCAIFDTYALYSMPSSAYWAQGKVPLKTVSKLSMDCLTGWISGFFGQTVNWRHPGWDTWCTYTDYIRKPSNAFEPYLMGFTPPSDLSTQDNSILVNALKSYFPEWNSYVNYYGLVDINNNDHKALDGIAKKHFSEVENTINKNKNVLEDRGFHGKYTFYIQNKDTGEKVSSFDVTFQ